MKKTQEQEDKMYLIKKCVQLWFWIRKVEVQHPIPERYDKQLLTKIQEIQPYLNTVVPHSITAHDGLVHFFDRNQTKKYFLYDGIKGFIHNDVLRPFHYDPLIESPLKYKAKVRKMLQ